MNEEEKAEAAFRKLAELRYIYSATENLLTNDPHKIEDAWNPNPSDSVDISAWKERMRSVDDHMRKHMIEWFVKRSMDWWRKNRLSSSAIKKP